MIQLWNSTQAEVAYLCSPQIKLHCSFAQDAKGYEAMLKHLSATNSPSQNYAPFLCNWVFIAKDTQRRQFNTRHLPGSKR